MHGENLKLEKVLYPATSAIWVCGNKKTRE